MACKKSKTHIKPNGSIQHVIYSVQWVIRNLITHLGPLTKQTHTKRDLSILLHNNIIYTDVFDGGLNCLKHNSMTSIIIIQDSQPYTISQYKKIKGQILKYNTNICFNEQ
jgi:hypothetical protein